MIYQMILKKGLKLKIEKDREILNKGDSKIIKNIELLIKKQTNYFINFNFIQANNHDPDGQVLVNKKC